MNPATVKDQVGMVLMMVWLIITVTLILWSKCEQIHDELQEIKAEIKRGEPNVPD